MAFLPIMTFLAKLTAVPLAGLSLLAQSTPNMEWHDAPFVPRGMTNVTFGRSVVGEFSEHQVPDIVVLAAGNQGAAYRQTAILVAAPSIHTSAVALPGTVGKTIRDVAVLRRGDPNMRRDALLLATEQGLFRWTFDGALTRFGGNLWNAATRLEVGDVDGDEIQDAIGRMGDAAGGNPANLRFLPIATGATGFFVNTGQAILDHVAIDWDANTSGTCDEVAVVHGDGVRFVKDGALAPSLFVALPTTSTAARIVGVVDAAGGRRLVVGTTDPAGQSLLFTIIKGGPTLCRPLPYRLANLTVVDRPAGSADGIVATFQNYHLPQLYSFDPAIFGSFGFDAGTPTGLTLGDSVGSGDARCLDLDADGDLDYFGSSTQLSAMTMLRTPGGLAPVQVTETLIGNGSIGYSCNAPASVTHVEILYYQALATYDEGTGDVVSIVLDPVARGRERLPATATWVYGTGAWPTVVSTVPGPFVALMRHVTETNGVVTWRGPLRTYAWSPNPQVTAFLQASSMAQFGLFPAGPLQPHYPGGVGGAITPPKPPPPDSDTPPGGGGG